MQIRSILDLRLFSSGALFLRTYDQYAAMNEFTCSEHSVRIRSSKKRSTGNQPLLRLFSSNAFFFYVRVLNTRQWMSLHVLSTPYVYVRNKKRITGKQPLIEAELSQMDLLVAGLITVETYNRRDSLWPKGIMIRNLRY